MCLSIITRSNSGVSIVMRSIRSVVAVSHRSSGAETPSCSGPRTSITFVRHTIRQQRSSWMPVMNWGCLSNVKLLCAGYSMGPMPIGASPVGIISIQISMFPCYVQIWKTLHSTVVTPVSLSGHWPMSHVGVRCGPTYLRWWSNTIRPGLPPFTINATAVITMPKARPGLRTYITPAPGARSGRPTKSGLCCLVNTVT